MMHYPREPGKVALAVGGSGLIDVPRPIHYTAQAAAPIPPLGMGVRYTIRGYSRPDRSEHGIWRNTTVSKEIFDLVYARVGARPLCLDLYLPEPQQRPTPLVVWIHGGAWRQGDRRTHCVATCLLPHGYAVASVSYRLSQEAIFPAQIHDCKAAVRWLRAHAEEYGLDPTALGAWGPSAGGHLVSLLGTTQGVPELEGELGNLEHSSAVQAVCDWFGPTDFRRMNDYPGDQDHDAPDSPESQLIGGPIQEHPDLVARANPVTYVSGNDPPLPDHARRSGSHRAVPAEHPALRGPQGDEGPLRAVYSQRSGPRRAGL